MALVALARAAARDWSFLPFLCRSLVYWLVVTGKPYHRC